MIEKTKLLTKSYNRDYRSIKPSHYNHNGYNLISVANKGARPTRQERDAAHNGAACADCFITLMYLTRPVSVACWKTTAHVCYQLLTDIIMY